jgi:aminomethyltransferase
MDLRQPPLYGAHEAAGASFTDFGGWEMPVEFDSIRTEHAAVRESVGKFDVSHMGEIEVSGADATELTDRLTTNDVGALDVGDAQYSTIPNADGNVIDDTVVYRLPDRDGDPTYLFVPNAGSDEAAHDRWVTHREEWALDATVENRTTDYGMIAVQGPEAVALVDAQSDADLAALSWFSARWATVAGVDCWVSRGGYTGGDGLELIVPVDDVEAVWSELDCQPCGLGARDTLRLEAGLLLSGQDFDVEENPRNPYEADIAFTVDLDTEFVGREALQGVQSEGVDETIVGLTLEERGIPRHGYEIRADGERIGTVTSGTMSPTLGEAIAMGYVPVEYADVGTELSVVVRGEPKQGRVESVPFWGRDQ